MTPDIEPVTVGGMEIKPPVRLCCWQRHWGVLCPDGLVLCCLCFYRYPVWALSVDPADGKPVDKCKQCAKDEEAEMKRKRS